MINIEKIKKMAEEKTKKKIPSSIRIEYLDYLDFSKLEIPKEILQCPVITVPGEDFTKIVINQTILAEYEYYVAELFTAQLLELLRDPEEMHKNSFFMNKNVILGKLIFAEFNKIQIMLEILEEIYKEEKVNPYTSSENMKIAESVAKSAINKKENKLSSFIYSFARTNADYDYSKCTADKILAQKLNDFNKLLKSKEEKNDRYFSRLGKAAKEIIKNRA